MNSCKEVLNNAIEGTSKSLEENFSNASIIEERAESPDIICLDSLKSKANKPTIIKMTKENKIGQNKRNSKKRRSELEKQQKCVNKMPKNALLTNYFSVKSID